MLLSQPQQLISYHMLFCQSSTFLTFFISFKSLFHRHSRWTFIIAPYFVKCQQLFQPIISIISISFTRSFHPAKVRKKRNLNLLRFFSREAIIKLPFISVKGTEKEGFEPSRRYKRPTPLAGAPLQPLEYFSTKLNYPLPI